MLLETYKRSLQELRTPTRLTIKNERYIIVYKDGLGDPYISVYTQSNNKILEVKNNEVQLLSPFKNLVLKALEGQYDHKEIAPVLKAFDTFYDDSFIADNKIYLNDKEITVKELGKKTKLNKIKQWSTIAERLQQYCTLRVKFFTDYNNIHKYYTHPVASEGSCMRYPFDNLPLHPCAVYAHDILDYCPDARDLVDASVKLAVLFDGDDLPVARCMVDTSTKQRAKAQGKRASELIKLLAGFKESYGLSGSHINLIPYEGKYIMPFIDGNDNVCEKTGEIGKGELCCANQDGTSFTGVWSEYYEDYFEEYDVIYSEYLDSYILADCFIETCEGYLVPETYDELCWSEHNEVHFIDAEDWHYLDFMGSYVLVEDVKQLCLDYIENNASLDELIDFANEI